MDQPDLVRLGIDVGKLRAEGVEEVPGRFLSSSLRRREITYCNCIDYGPNDGLDPEALTAVENDLRGRMFEIAELFRSRRAFSLTFVLSRWERGGRAAFSLAKGRRRKREASPSPDPSSRWDRDSE